MRKDIEELKQHEARRWDERNEAIKTAVHQTGYSPTEIALALETQDTVIPDPMTECDPDGVLRRVDKRWKSAKAVLDKALGK
jgi:hypothetical protein